MSDSQQTERREIYYGGRVQGVGFRYTTKSVAARFRVTGDVRNLSDGRVLLTAEGEPGELDRFLGTLEAEMGRHIRDRKVEVLPASGEYGSFRIRY